MWQSKGGGESEDRLRKSWQKANPSPGGKVYLRAVAVTKGQELFLFNLMFPGGFAE